MFHICEIHHHQYIEAPRCFISVRFIITNTLKHRDVSYQWFITNTLKYCCVSYLWFITNTLKHHGVSYLWDYSHRYETPIHWSTVVLHVGKMLHSQCTEALLLSCFYQKRTILHRFLLLCSILQFLYISISRSNRINAWHTSVSLLRPSSVCTWEN